jgi:hypothetical protein
MKLKSAISNLLTNKLVLHIIAFLSLFSVIGHMMLGHYNIVIYFIVLALLVRYFSKNMIVVLGIPLLLVNIMSMNKVSLMEGLENNSDSKSDDDKKTDDDTKKTDDTKKSNDTKKSDDKKTDAAGEPVVDASNEKKTDENFEVGYSKNRFNKPNIDYATTIEDAYDQLNSILGKDGIKNLTSDTERLMQQQAQLAGNLKDMGPLIEKMEPMMQQVQNMMQNLPTGQQGGVMEKVTEMMGGMKK